MCPIRAAAALLALAVAGGCGSQGSGSSSSIGSAQPGIGAGASGASQAHWQVALAALSGTPRPMPIGMDPAAFREWNAMIARCWPGIRAGLLDPALETALRSQLTSLGSGAVTVQSIRNVVIDTAAPPVVTGSGASPSLGLAVEIPGGPGTWRIAFTADAVASYRTSVFGVPITTSLAVDLSVEIADLRLAEDVRFDATNPAHPILTSPGVPRISLDLNLSSSTPLVGPVLAQITSVLDPLIRIALIPGAILAQQQIGIALSGLPQTTWGTGAAPTTGVPGAPTLGPIADAFSDEIQRVHLPFDTLLQAVYDQPVSGGNLLEYDTYGDSAIWTGHYVAAEALRYDVTGDPRALAGAARALGGLEACLDVASHVSDGLLGRCVVPLSSPRVAEVGNLDRFVGTVKGVPHLSEGDISRDQYLGAFLACTQAYLRVPALRQQARSMTTRMLGHCERNDWVILKVGAPVLSRAAALCQTPTVELAWVAVGNLVDPARFGPLYAHVKDVASVGWLLAWLASREMHDSYYKFNLFHDEASILTSLEADPAAYREHVKAIEVMRDAVGHHDNAWFDSIYGAAVPSETPAMGARVENELQRYTLRPRREFDIDYTQDPTIAKVPYAPPATSPGAVAQIVAVYPLPIEKRYGGSFLWQNNPFRLVDPGDERCQSSGVDFLVPYWMARAYGMLKYPD